MEALTDTIHVLHVDSEPDQTDLAAMFLEREDERIVVRTASSAGDGLEILADHAIDCIVSDYDMPHTNGLEFLQSVREQHPDLPFILYTGNGSEEIASQAISAGVTDYVQKDGTESYALLANRIIRAVQEFKTQQFEMVTKQEPLTLLERISDAFLALDTEWRFTFVNENAAEVFDESVTNLLGTEIWEFFPEAKDTPFYDHYQQAMEDGKPRTIEEYFEPWNAWYRKHLYPSESGLSVLFQDITEQKERESELARVRERTQLALEHTNSVIYEIDLSTGAVSRNGPFEQLFHLPSDEIPTWEDHLSRTVHPDDREKFQRFYQQFTDGERTVGELEYRTNPESGDVRWIEDHVQVENMEALDSRRAIGIAREITDRKERERTLQTMTQQFDAICENTPTPMFLKDDGGEYVFVNRAYRELFDMEETNIVGKTDADLHPPETVAEVQKTDQDVLESGEPVQSEERIIINGEQRTFLSTKAPIYDMGDRSHPDEPVAVFGVAIDITERKQYEEQLREEQQFVQSIFESLPDLLYAFDTDGYLLRWNEQLEAVTGYSNDEIGDMHMTEFVPEEEVDTIARDLQQIFEDRRSATAESVVETKDGKRIPFELSGAPLEDADGDLRGMTGVARDITERKNHEQRLEALNQATRRLLTAETTEEVAEIGVEVAKEVLGLDASGIYLYDDEVSALKPVAVTNVASNLVGEPPTFTGDESIAWRVYEQGDPLAVDDVHDDTDIYNPDSPVRSELYLPLGEDGILIAGSPSVAAFDHRDIVLGEILAGNIVTALEQIERTEQLRTREQELTRQNDRLEKFTDIVSHDLRNPLIVAEGRLELARTECDSTHLDSIEEVHNRMRTLIEELLTLAQESEAVADCEPVNLAALVEDCWTTVETSDATLITDCSKTIQADESRLKQLFENLIRNAVEHGGEAVTVTVGDFAEGFYVEDDGPGIPEGLRNEVFESGYSSDEYGTGLGLSIVRQIVKAHNWTIRVTEGTAGGARFEIRCNGDHE